ncbi:MAG: hypothetical protein KatS3mg097_524 [Candidatus Parcubacteria bacterium]|nr:MAG: hypothetical protein KatS3mg097_524 [Candidatus Parcubacteria bacterium]
MDIKRAKEELQQQQKIREEKVEIRGQYTAKVESFINIAENILEELRQTDPEVKLNEIKILNLAQELGLEIKDVEQTFLDGLRLNIKAAFRIGILHPKQNIQIQKERLKKIIGAYGLSFRSVLKKAKNEIKKGSSLTPSLILNIAKRQHLLGPNILKELKKKYPLIDEWIIKHTIINYPKKIDEFIQQVMTEIERLKEKYPQIDERIIKHAAVHYIKDETPDQFIEKVLREIERLKEKYNIDDWIIKHAAVHHPSTTDQFIKQVLKTIQRLKQKYPHIDD